MTFSISRTSFWQSNVSAFLFGFVLIYSIALVPFRVNTKGFLNGEGNCTGYGFHEATVHYIGAANAANAYEFGKEEFGYLTVYLPFGDGS